VTRFSAVALVALVLVALLVAAAGARTVKPALRVTQSFVGSVHYIEGSIGYVRIENHAGRRLSQKTFRNTAELRFALLPGSYRLVSFQRPCDGNCGYLDPPTDRCARVFRVRAHESVSARVLVSPGSGCTIELS
jgi:hypothetical protein